VGAEKIAHRNLPGQAFELEAAQARSGCASASSILPCCSSLMFSAVPLVSGAIASTSDTYFEITAAIAVPRG
jgi:hypothetical protein